MSTSLYPPPDVVLAETAEFLRVAGSALDAGTAEARDYFDRRNCPIEVVLGSMITRSVAKQLLNQHGHVTQEFETLNIGLVGLRVILPCHERSYRIAIWKSPDERIPAPGTSRTRNFFLERNQLTLDLHVPLDLEEYNLVLVWNATPAFILTDLFLHMPIGISEAFYKSPESCWSRRIPLPVQQFLRTSPVQADAEASRLPYEKAREEDTEVGQGR